MQILHITTNGTYYCLKPLLFPHASVNIYRGIVRYGAVLLLESLTAKRLIKKLNFHFARCFITFWVCLYYLAPNEWFSARFCFKSMLWKPAITQDAYDSRFLLLYDCMCFLFQSSPFITLYYYNAFVGNFCHCCCSYASKCLSKPLPCAHFQRLACLLTSKPITSKVLKIVETKF